MTKIRVWVSYDNVTVSEVIEVPDLATQTQVDEWAQEHVLGRMIEWGWSLLKK